MLQIVGVVGECAVVSNFRSIIRDIQPDCLNCILHLSAEWSERKHVAMRTLHRWW